MATAKSLWLCLRFPYLSMNSLGVRFTTSQATAITHQQSIYLTNHAAELSGVQPGQSVGHALMIKPNLQLLDHDGAQSSQKLETISHWAYRFSSQIHVYDEHTLLLEIGRSITLFKGLKHLQHLIKHDLENFRVDVLYGLANTPKAAHLLSFSPQEDWSKCNIQWQLEMASLTNLAIDKKTLDKLTGCGFKTLSDLLAIPKKEISQRFEQSFVCYLERLLGEIADPQLLTLPPENFSRSIDFAEPIRNRNWIEKQIHYLLDELISFLNTRNLVCRDFSWRFYAQNNRLLKKVTINLASAQSDFETYLELSDLHFASMSMRWEFSGIELSSDSLVQRHQFHNDLFDPKPDQEGIRHFIEKIVNRLGQKVVHRVSAQAEHLPEFANQYRQIDQVLSCNQPPEPIYKDEPLCLLESPKKLHQQDGYPTHKGGLYLIHGPHRISSHWWIHLHSRDYYIARQNSGALLWVYYERNQHSWYLHGLFA